jgi:hypothetical protein
MNDMSPTTAAAMWGLAQNPAVPLHDRLQHALQALEFYGNYYIEHAEKPFDFNEVSWHVQPILDHDPRDRE